jgi:glycyl-tRNA synthetase alpha subunit
VIWTVVSTTPVVGAPQVEWDVAVERATTTDITYWITIRNLTSAPVNIEARYAIANI